METELWPNLVRECRARRRAAPPRERAAVGEVGARLRAHRVARPSERSAISRRSARRPRPTRRGSPRSARPRRGHRQPQVRPRAAARDARPRPRAAAALRRPARLPRGEHARRRGARYVLDALGRDAARRRPGRDRARAIRSVSTRWRRCSATADSSSSGGARGSRCRPARATCSATAMGEMTAYYAAADVAFVGGSLLAFGAQNLIEACAVGAPVAFGPSIFNFAQAAEEAVKCRRGDQVPDADVARARGGAAARRCRRRAGGWERREALLRRTSRCDRAHDGARRAAASAIALASTLVAARLADRQLPAAGAARPGIFGSTRE